MPRRVARAAGVVEIALAAATWAVLACMSLKWRHKRGAFRASAPVPMDMMTLSPGWLLFAAMLFVAFCALWTGTLFSVSWLTGRARMMADGPEVAGLALSLFRRWALPLLVASIAVGFVWLVGGPPERLRAHWVYGIVAALAALTTLHVVVGARAKRVVRGSTRAMRGEAIRRLALLVSFGAIIALVAFRGSFVP